MSACDGVPQLCKQTTENNSSVPTSCERGWELMAISVNFNPPSKKFFSYLEGYVNRNTTDSTPQRIREYATYCLKRLNRIRDTGIVCGGLWRLCCRGGDTGVWAVGESESADNYTRHHAQSECVRVL